MVWGVKNFGVGFGWLWVLRVLGFGVLRLCSFGLWAILGVSGLELLPDATLLNARP